MPNDFSAADPRCEYLTDPLAIDVPRPRLSWTVRSDRRGARQTAYRLLVAHRREAILASEGDVWESGRVTDSRSTHVPYGGPDLRSGQRCWWGVQVWDEAGNGPFHSEPAWWEMGLLRPDDWRASWIGADASEEAATLGVAPSMTPSPYLRTSFVLSQPVRSARLYSTARGVYEARLNGRRVGDAVLAPGWTDYAKRIQYQTYDVDDLLRDGENVLGAILGGGWFCGHVGFAGEHSHYGDRPQVLAQLVIEHADGTTTLVVSDGFWRVATGPILASDLLMGETYDAREELLGWDAPGYDDTAWAPALAAERDATPLVADRAEPVRVVEDLRPREITRRDAETFIVDLGQNMVGWVRLRARGPAGTRVQLRFAEVLDADGGLYVENLRTARQTDTFVLNGEGVEIFEPRFTFHGFRYVEVRGYPGELAADAITGRVVESATPDAGTFECSDDRVNRLQRAIVWGQRGNFLSIPTDCPQRDERLGWLADAQVFAPTACFNRDVAAFYSKWLIDIADGRSVEGAFPDVAPRLVNRADGAPAWGDGGVVLPWTLYQVYGDERLLAEHYDAMAGWLAYIEAANPDLRWRNRRNNDFGDWLSIQADTPKELIGTAYFAYDARLLARMARVLGRDDDATRFDALFERIKTAFVADYVAEDGQIAGDAQTGYVLALQMDLLPADQRPAAARHLVADIAARDGHLSTGFVGIGHLLPVLTEAGSLDVAYRLLLNETFPSWGYMIRHGATTIWERWDGWTEERGFQDPGMNSFNHYAFGAVGAWLYRTIAGIDLDSDRPGFEHVVIRPRPGGDLTWARATYRSIRGPIASAWRIENGAFHLDVTIPANTTATVHVPTADASAITEGGVLTRDAPHVTFVREDAGAAVFGIAAGTYRFTSGSLAAMT